MESNLLRRNEKLPPELLGIIFAHFGDTETFDHSLETLLLVCRSWTRAALDHRSLWGRINITIQHQETFKRCMARVKSRMQRSGSLVPLEIQIKIDLDEEGTDPKCTRSNRDFWTSQPNCCYHQAVHLMTKLLGEISGQDGIHCERWRSLILEFPIEEPYSNRDASILEWRSLSYPTPTLRSLTIYFAEWLEPTLQPMLPSCPCLRYLRLFGTNLSQLSDLKNVQKMVIIWFGGSASLDLSGLTAAPSLLELTLELGGEDSTQFPISISSLTHLTIEDLDVAEDVSLPYLPNLKFLKLKCSNHNSMATMARWENLPFKGMVCVEMVLGKAWVDGVLELVIHYLHS